MVDMVESRTEALSRQTAPDRDPLRYCVFTTIGLLAWVLTPAAVVLWMSTLGILGYGRAWRNGLRKSRCWLGDVRLVLAYLTVSWVLSAVFTAGALIRLIG